MYKCTQCGHMQDTEGACQQCGSPTVMANDSNGSDVMPEEQESAEESAVSEKPEETM